MRRFIITSNKFTGTAEIIFNRDDVLCRIDCSSTDMNAATVKDFKRAVPSDIAELLVCKSFGAGTSITEASYRISFEQFWNDYGKKINKARCTPWWDRLSDGDTVLAWLGIKPYNRFLSEVKVRQKLDPENYIKNRAWENQWQ